MINEECIGEYEMHHECRTCSIQSACKRKFHLLMRKYKEYLAASLPQRSRAKDYIELQKMEAERQHIADQIKKIRAREIELRELKYNKTQKINKFFGVSEECNPTN